MSIELVKLRDTRTGIVSETGLDGAALDRFLRENPDIVRAGLNTTGDYPHYVLLGQNNIEFLEPTTSDIIYNPFSNRLGIGSFNPQATLDVLGDIKFDGNFTNSGVSTFLGPANFFGDVFFDRLEVGVATITKKLDVGVGGTVLTAIASTDPNIVGVATSYYGNIGIGSTLPQEKIDIAGSIKIDENIYDSTNYSGLTGFYLSRDENGIRWVQVNPAESAGIIVYNDLELVGTGQSFFGINLQTGNGLGVTTDTIQAFANPSNSGIADILVYDYWSAGSGLNIYRNSNVGINNDNPQFSLDITGSANITQTLDVGGFTDLSGNLSVGGTTGLSSSLTVDGITTLNDDLNVTGDISASGNVSAVNLFGAGDAIVGIVTQIIPSIGINISSTQQSGKGVVTIDAYTPAGKTIFVNQNGNDLNSGLTENDAKRTIKSAASIALFGDTIKLFPGTYVEDNPIVLNPTVSVE